MICFIAVAVRVSFSASTKCVLACLKEEISSREYHELNRSSVLHGCSDTTVENSEKLSCSLNGHCILKAANNYLCTTGNDGSVHVGTYLYFSFEN